LQIESESEAASERISIPVVKVSAAPIEKQIKVNKVEDAPKPTATTRNEVDAHSVAQVRQKVDRSKQDSQQKLDLNPPERKPKERISIVPN
jgi:hypothetical protein